MLRKLKQAVRNVRSGTTPAQRYLLAELGPPPADSQALMEALDRWSALSDEEKAKW